MKMMTLRLKPKTIFGLILIITGAAVIAVTFFSNHASQQAASGSVTLETADSRAQYLTSLGWEFDSEYTEKLVTIPAEFNDTYSDYNELQLGGGFDLTPYKGQEVTVYTYALTNYAGYENSGCIYANLIVYNNELIGGDVCSTSVSDGFIEVIQENI
ncbi:MAG: DUF4830 domain-containing protein [Clostridiales bacterium]|nr:DUF4830 domain-containing protein [Clostridiales bacterium]